MEAADQVQVLALHCCRPWRANGAPADGFPSALIRGGSDFIRGRELRLLRRRGLNLLAALSLLMCVAVVLFWGRSYLVKDHLAWLQTDLRAKTRTPERGCLLVSGHGVVVVYELWFTDRPPSAETDWQRGTARSSKLRSEPRHVAGRPVRRRGACTTRQITMQTIKQEDPRRRDRVSRRLCRGVGGGGSAGGGERPGERPGAREQWRGSGR